MNIFLTEYEEIYIRLLINGKDDSEIKSILSISSSKLLELKRSIVKKNKTNNWVLILIKLINLRLIQIDELSDDFLNERALSQSELLLNKFNKIDKLTSLQIEKEVKRFCLKTFDTYKSIYLQRKATERLTIKELAFLNLKSKRVSKKEILKEVNIDENEYNLFETTIFYKLRVCNWFNAFRNSIKYNLIKKQRIYEEPKEVEALFLALYNSENSRKEKKIIIYKNLILNFCAYEFKLMKEYLGY